MKGKSCPTATQEKEMQARGYGPVDVLLEQFQVTRNLQAHWHEQHLGQLNASIQKRETSQPASASSPRGKPQLQPRGTSKGEKACWTAGGSPWPLGAPPSTLSSSCGTFLSDPGGAMVQSMMSDDVIACHNSVREPVLAYVPAKSSLSPEGMHVYSSR